MPRPVGDAADDQQIGAAVRATRTRRGLSVRALAAAAGISPSALSQIERGTKNPSLTTIRRLASAMGEPVFRLFGEDTGEAEIVVRPRDRKTLGVPGSDVTYQLLSPNLQGRLEVLYFEIRAGGVTADEGMSHPGEECLFVLEGQGRLELPGRSHDIAEGDSITFPAGAPHALRNVGDGTLRAISAITPPHF